MIAAAADPDAPGAREALSRLCQSYWYPLYAYVRRRVDPAEEAQDLTQEFFARLLDKQWFRAADSERGRFRAYLLAAMKHFLAAEREKQAAQKRGGGRRVLSLSLEDGEERFQADPEDHETPDRRFEREWARVVLESVLSQLKDEYEQAGKALEFELLHPFLTDPDQRGSYRDVAESLGRSEGAARMAAHRMRQRYRETLIQEITHTVADPAEVEDEIRQLFRALRCDGP